MPALMCARVPADQIDYDNERFVVCKWIGVLAGGQKFEMGDELPKGILNARALREIYDTPTRLIETMDYALADEDLLKSMMARPVADLEEDDDGETEPLKEEKELAAATVAPVVTANSAPAPKRPSSSSKKRHRR